MKIIQVGDLIELKFDSSVKDEQKQVELGEYILEEIKNIQAKNPGKKFNILLDLTQQDLLIDASSWKAVQVYRKMVNLEQTHRTAIVGKPSFADLLIEVAFDKIMHKKVSWFTDREKAIKWMRIGL